MCNDSCSVVTCTTFLQSAFYVLYEIECSSNYTYSLYEYFDGTLLLPPPPKKREGES